MKDVKKLTKDYSTPGQTVTKYNHKLTPEQIEVIHAWAVLSILSAQKLAKLFQVSKQTINYQARTFLKEANLE